MGSRPLPRLPSEAETAPGSSAGPALSAWRTFLEPTLLFLFPPRCRCCDTPLEQDDAIRICPPCWQKVELIQGDLCPRCGYPLSDMNPERGGYCGQCPRRPVHFDRARAGAAYDGAVRSLIHGLKFRFHTDIAPFLASFLVPLLEEELGRKVDMLVPVPLHWIRHRWREFNQSTLLANALGKRLGIPVEAGRVKRVRRTKPQSRTSGASAKRRNVRGAFRVTDTKGLTGKGVLLVDDIYTSGSTVNECARVLKQAGAGQVYVLTVARLIKGTAGTEGS